MNDQDKKQQGQPHSPELAAQFAEMLEAARASKMMYEALIEAGFTEGQALSLVGSAFGGQR